VLAPYWFPVGSLIPSVLLANTPQVIMAFCYFVYNSFLTRLEVEKEWNSYSSETHKPLRVSYPVGKQTSTYRLQLPYRWSIPLLIASTLLHWLVSKTLYVFVIEGGYIDYGYGHDIPDPSGQGLSSDAFIGMGFSTSSILLALVLSAVLASVPLVFSRWRRFASRGDMVLCGSSSMVISAACHPSRVNIVGRDDDAGSLKGPSAAGRKNAESVEMSNLMSPRTKSPTDAKGGAVGGARDVEDLPSPGPYGGGGDEDRPEGSQKSAGAVPISSRLLRWGVVPMPDAFAAQYRDVTEEVGHLSFGVAEQDVQPPRVGMYYA
jgi:hypothetical protein